MLLELGEYYIELSHITCLRPAGRYHTSVWVTGQSAVDGAFLVDLPIDEVLELIQEGRLTQVAIELAQAESRPDSPGGGGGVYASVAGGGGESHF